MIKKLMVICSLVFSPIALSGEGSGLIQSIYVHDKNNGDGVVMFSVKTHTNKPSCSSHEWAFDLNTTQGKAMYTFILSAAAMGKPVLVKGKNACSAWDNREEPKWVRVTY